MFQGAPSTLRQPSAASCIVRTPLLHPRSNTRAPADGYVVDQISGIRRPQPTARGSASEKQLLAARGREGERESKKKARGQGVDVRHGQLHAAGSKFLLASESNVRHYRPLPGGPFRPSLPCCLSAALVWRGVRFEGLRAAVWSYIISCRIAMFAVLNGLMSGY